MVAALAASPALHAQATLQLDPDSLRVAPHLTHLLDHLRVNGLLCPLAYDEATLRTYSSEEVRSRICSGDPSWKDLVSPEVAALIESRGYFGGRCG